jgi:hypothetical protein
MQVGRIRISTTCSAQWAPRAQRERPRRRKSAAAALAAGDGRRRPRGVDRKEEAEDKDVDDDRRARSALAGGWPNALRLPATAPHRPSVPSLLRARHYVNLSAGADALPLLLRAPGGLPPPRFCRITSTACEQQDLARVTLSEIADASLLMDLALGESPVVIWDAGSRRRRRRPTAAAATTTRGDAAQSDAAADADDDGACCCCPRALWYGAEFARWALHTLWFEGNGGGGPARAYLRGHNAAREWERHLRAADPPLLRRLRYFGRYVPPAARRRAAAAAAGGSEGGPQLDSGPFALRLYGCYRGTDRDGDPDHFVSRVHEDGDARRARRRAAAGAEQGGGGGGEAARADDEAAARRMVLEAGWRVFAGGVGHEEVAGLLLPT